MRGCVACYTAGTRVYPRKKKEPSATPSHPPLRSVTPNTQTRTQLEIVFNQKHCCRGSVCNCVCTRWTTKAPLDMEKWTVYSAEKVDNSSTRCAMSTISLMCKKMRMLVSFYKKNWKLQCVLSLHVHFLSQLRFSQTIGNWLVKYALYGITFLSTLKS